MKQLRFQPLNVTYQKLGAGLCNIALSIQTTDYTNTAAWLQLVAQVKNTCAAFKTYAVKEEIILFPLLHDYEPALVSILLDERRKRLQYLANLEILFTAKSTAKNNKKIKIFSHKLVYCLPAFTASAVQEMNEHESMINAVLWRYYSDKVLVQTGAFFTAQQPTQQYKTGLTLNAGLYKHTPSATIPQYHKRTGKSYSLQHRAAMQPALTI